MRAALKCAAVAALACLAIAAPAAAKTYEVNKRSDHTPNGCKKKDCTLREAVLAANARDGSDRVVLPERKTYNLSIENSIPPGEDEAAEGDLDVTDPLRVTHPGKGKAKVDANGIDRVFHLLEGGPTTFKRVVIRGGDDPSGDGWGGGIRASADLVLLRSSVVGNRTVNDDGGGIAFPDGTASLTMRRSALKNNFSGDDGGGFSFDDGGSGTLFIDRSKITGNASDDFGGGFISDASGTIKRTTVAGNRALSGWAGGGDFEGADAPVISDSTFSGNTALDSQANGGGLVIDSAEQAALTNVTLTNNRAGQAGGGLYVIGAAAALNAVTATRNSAEFGGGLFSQTTDPFEVSNSLIALNTATDAGPDCTDDGGPASAFNIDSLGHNLIGDDSDCNDAFDATGDFVNSNPKLGQLKNNGGPTQTVALKKGSPAINKADKGSAPRKDQRGEKRGKKPDIGAYERIKKKKGKKRR